MNKKKKKKKKKNANANHEQLKSTFKNHIWQGVVVPTGLEKSLSFDINICKESGVVIRVPEVALYSGYSGLGL